MLGLKCLQEKKVLAGKERVRVAHGNEGSEVLPGNEGVIMLLKL